MRLCRVWPIYPFKKHIPAHPKTTGHQLFLAAAELTPDVGSPVLAWDVLLCGGCLHPHQFPCGVPREGIYPPSPGPVPRLPQLGVCVRPCESSPSVLMATTGAPVCHSLGSAAELTRKRWMRAPCGEHEAPCQHSPVREDTEARPCRSYQGPEGPPGQSHPSPPEMLQLWEGRRCHLARPGHLNLGAAGSARFS